MNDKWRQNLIRMSDQLSEAGWQLYPNAGEVSTLYCFNPDSELGFSTYGHNLSSCYGKAMRIVFPDKGVTNKDKIHPKKLIGKIDLAVGLFMLQFPQHLIDFKFVRERRYYRLAVFLEKGVRCVSCGIEGSYFSVIQDGPKGRVHMNLYAQNESGSEVLMTCDHIRPQCKGGTNDMSNLQPMCEPCNGKKGAKII